MYTKDHHAALLFIFVVQMLLLSCYQGGLLDLWWHIQKPPETQRSGWPVEKEQIFKNVHCTFFFSDLCRGDAVKL